MNNIPDELYYDLAIAIIKTWTDDYEKAVRNMDLFAARSILKQLRESEYLAFLVKDPDYIIQEIQKQYGSIEDLEKALLEREEKLRKEQMKNGK